MKSVRVQYQVKEGYVNFNKANIKEVMADLKLNPIEGMNYSSYYLGNGKFMHLNVMSNESASEELNKREAFTRFRVDLRASHPILPPQTEEIELVGSSLELN